MKPYCSAWWIGCSASFALKTKRWYHALFQFSAFLPPLLHRWVGIQKCWSNKLKNSTSFILTLEKFARLRFQRTPFARLTHAVCASSSTWFASSARTLLQIFGFFGPKKHSQNCFKNLKLVMLYHIIHIYLDVEGEACISIPSAATLQKPPSRASEKWMSLTVIAIPIMLWFLRLKA